MPDRRTAPSAVVLDNEAVQALSDVQHPKHRLVIAHVAAVVTGRARGAGTRLAVPTSVRVEAGWDRRKAKAAVINRVRLVDHALDAGAANGAASIRLRTKVSIADAHLGVVAQELSSSGEVVVLTSDPADVAAASAPAKPRVVRI